MNEENNYKIKTETLKQTIGKLNPEDAINALLDMIAKNILEIEELKIIQKLNMLTSKYLIKILPTGLDKEYLKEMKNSTKPKTL